MVDLLSEENRVIVSQLRKRIDRRAKRYELYEDICEGSQQVRLMNLAVPPWLGSFAFPFMWPSTVVDANAHRMDVKGFLVGKEIDSSVSLQELWDVNDLEATSEQVHHEALVQGCSFVSIGSNPDDKNEPLIVPESSRYLAMRINPKTRKSDAALRVYASDDGLGRPVDAGVLYLPDETFWFQTTRNGLEVTDYDRHGLGVVPIVPFVNRGRLAPARRDRFGNYREPAWGRSEMATVIEPTAMAAGVLAATRVASEIAAVPRALLTGATGFKDKNGKPIDAFESYLQSLWAVESTEVQLHTLKPAELSNLTNVINMLAQQAAAASFLPWEYFGLHTQTPASADAIRANQDRLTKMVERRNRVFGAAWGNVMGIGELFRGNKVAGNRVLTQWYDPGTPTFGQKADGIMKLTGGKPILSTESGLDLLGFSPEQIAREKERLDLARATEIGELAALTADVDTQLGKPPADDFTQLDATLGGALTTAA